MSYRIREKNAATHADQALRAMATLALLSLMLITIGFAITKVLAIW